MNKKLLTAVVTAALVAGPMTASAAASVFGVFHLSVDRVDNDGAGTAAAPALTEGYLSSNDSYVGVKGDEDIGGGLKAIYQVIAAFNADDGASGLGGTLKDTFLGFASGDAGTLRFGRMDTPSKLLLSSVEQFRNRGGDMRVLTGTPSLMFGNFDNRLSNQVFYTSPSLAGVVISAAYATGETATQSASATTVKSFSAVWTGGPFMAGISRETHNVLPTPTNINPESEESLRFAGKAGFGAFEVTAFMDQQSDLAGVAGADRDVLGVGGKFKFGNSALKAQLAKADKVDKQATENGGKIMAVGFEHSLSKTTLVYVDYSKADNDSGVSIYSPAIAPVGHGSVIGANTTGSSPTMFSLGAVLKF
jgi:predicted porin